MARIQVVLWRDIPLQVRARGEDGKRTSLSLSPRFQQAADAAAMAGDQTTSEAYLEAVRTTAWEEAPGDPRAAAERRAAELEAEFSDEQLKHLARAGGNKA